MCNVSVHNRSPCPNPQWPCSPAVRAPSECACVRDNDPMRFCFQGKSALPYPDKGYYAVVNEDELATNKSIKLFDALGISAIPSDPPIFVQCGQDRCKGGPKFECEHGYRGTACAECTKGQFYWNGKCDTDCKDIEPQGVVTVFGILGVMLVWIILNKSAGGMCATPSGSVAPPRLSPDDCFAIVQIRMSRCWGLVRLHFTCRAEPSRAEPTASACNRMPTVTTYRYMQIMATVFTFTTRYDAHTSHYSLIVAICRACTVPNISGRVMHPMLMPPPSMCPMRNPCRIGHLDLPCSSDIVNLNVDFVSPSCLMSSGVWTCVI